MRIDKIIYIIKKNIQPRRCATFITYEHVFTTPLRVKHYTMFSAEEFLAVIIQKKKIFINGFKSITFSLSSFTRR